MTTEGDRGSVQLASASLRLTIETSPLFGFFGLALIALVLFGLWWVFQKYGRR